MPALGTMAQASRQRRAAKNVAPTWVYSARDRGIRLTRTPPQSEDDMRAFSFANTGRWVMAAGLATGVALSATQSEAFERLFPYITTTNNNCVQDAQGNNYYTDAWGLDSHGVGVCTVGAALETPDAYGFGSTAETVCSDLNTGANHAVTHFVNVAAYSASTGGMSTPCNSAPTSWTVTSSCSTPAAVQGNCPAGQTIGGYAYGNTF
jgi:hypothetical protein